jgi:hypothetical protein
MKGYSASASVAARCFDWQRWWVYTLRDGLIARAQFCLDESTAVEAAGAGGGVGAAQDQFRTG